MEIWNESKGKAKPNAYMQITHCKRGILLDLQTTKS